MDDAKLAVRRRLYEDFGFYSEAALKIRTKEQKIEQFRLNEAQRRLLVLIDKQLSTRGYVRIIILKGRQMGLSTMIGGWLYWWVSQRAAQKALVVAHKGDATQSLFDMTRRYHEKMPDILKPSTKYSSRKELVFDRLDSSYAVVTAGGDGIGRSETITAAHLSEIAFWPKGSARENFSGLMDTIPTREGTAVFMESTANGISGVFYEQCKKAFTGQSDFEFIFLPWFIDPGYRALVPEGFIRTHDEEVLAKQYDLDDEQLMFRRHRIAEKGPELFQQEYPCNADEAFLTSGRPVFPAQAIHTMLQNARAPIAEKALVPGENGRWVWEDSRIGELKCFLPHDPHETYYLGADVGGGVRKDYSVVQVLDSKRRQAAIWRSDRVDPDHFGTVLAHLGEFYNQGFVICERNNHGILTNRVLTKDHEYPNYYTEKVVDKVSDTETTHVGFFTSEKSKPLVIGKLRAEIRDRALEIYDRETLEELQAYILTENGKMEAEEGKHDDCVVSLALANHVNEGSFEPIENQPEWYLPDTY